MDEFIEIDETGTCDECGAPEGVCICGFEYERS